MALLNNSLELIDALILKNLSGVGDDTVTKLIKFSTENKISRIEELSGLDLNTIGIRKVPKSLLDLLNESSLGDLRHEIESRVNEWKRIGITVIHLGSKSYPIQLLELQKPPPFLFCRGNVSLLSEKKAIAVIGTRENTRKGQRITEKTIEAFSNYGFSIVSGLALGIDKIAHQSALKYQAPTVAVLVDVLNISPATNRTLADDILANNGVLLAENEPGTRAIPAFFAKRDRIQAGLSASVFAIETSVTGGTMHAVNAALSMNRPVYVPNSKAAGYKDMTAKEISGIQHLLNENKAIPYTKENYASIAKQLTDRASCVKEDHQIGLF